MSDTCSPRALTRGSSFVSPLCIANSLHKDGDDRRPPTLHGSSSKNSEDKASSYVGSPPKHSEVKSSSHVLSPKAFPPRNFIGGSAQSLSSGISDGVNEQMKSSATETVRVSMSSVVSSSSQGSGHEDADAIRDVFIWGEDTGEGALGGGIHRAGTCAGVKIDSLLPKAVELTALFDIRSIACGGKHAALVTREGELFSWGEDSGGRLGHGVNVDVSHPKLVNSLSGVNVAVVACGEYHTCAVTLSGELYTWGDGAYHSGLLGHGDEVSKWIPKRVNFPLGALPVSSVSCGPWHTAVVTSAGQLFTFGDGTFGVLGHGDCRSVTRPREVETLRGLRTICAACGVWHTAAVVDVMCGTPNSNGSSGRLFTWGDGYKGMLGHGDNESRLVPASVVALAEFNFSQVACGHRLTVALAASGHVYTMGSTVYGQLGNVQSDGKIPARVEGKLQNGFVEEISCGAYHVTALTSRTEVYTWGKGANGQLGHGDTRDRNAPCLVEALKDKQVKSVVCGSNFTAAICLHKQVSSIDQSMCSGCHLPFNFKRKRHNCYNCGLLFCNACAAKKSVKASMAPNCNKPYRVCGSCFNKLKKNLDKFSGSHATISRTGSTYLIYSGSVEKDDIFGLRSEDQMRLSSAESLTHVEGTYSSNGKKKLDLNSTRVSPVPHCGSQWGGFTSSGSFNPVFGSAQPFFSDWVPGSRVVSGETSISRLPSPLRSTTQTTSLVRSSSPKIGACDARTDNSLTHEVLQLRVQVEHLTQKAELLEVELEKASKQFNEAMTIAREERAKCKAAKEVIEALSIQFKAMDKRLLTGDADLTTPGLLISKGSSTLTDAFVLHAEELSSVSTHCVADRSLTIINKPPVAHVSSYNTIQRENHIRVGNSGASTRNIVQSNQSHEHDGEWVEQDEPGVYITLTSLHGGTNNLKRVRFSRKQFSKERATQWWAENQTRVCKQYNVHMVDKCGIFVGHDAASS
ncbi:PH, RCC1 and FYVE domains-containing protein 1-like isoform X1 [Nymphaea colorata]|nr:PH, RCC1 and FYVE domains-containing protein 1-like isoform X1 [Nymphaea colorata]XP_049931729.1 PH, RCC1 and FYVE domains-containing protein 1-like isoform X1 [Nymphaea colorata]